MSPTDRPSTPPPTPGRPGPRVAVVGVGADGWPGLGEAVRARLAAAPVVLGTARQLSLVAEGVGQERRREVGRPYLDALLGALAGIEAGPVVVLASGDPLVSGVGSVLVERLGAERVEVVPAVSSVALARARLGWSAESTAVVSLVGRDPHLLLRELAPGRRVLVLSADGRTPERVAALLRERGLGGARLVVLGDLGAPTESRTDATAESWSGDAPALTVVAVEIADHPPVPLPGWTPGLPDDLYEHDGQLTKRDARAGALARLAPQPGQLLWDVGAGAGSVGIEWMRAHPTCRAVAVEADPERAARIGRNAERLGVPGLRVVEGRAPDALGDLPAPDAVFVGGGATVPGVLEHCRSALRPGGRLVAHGVTVETEQTLLGAHASWGGELTRTAVEHAEPLGRFTGWTPARTITQWTLIAPLG